MNFHGLQKMTLLDYPGKVACTLFTGGCNMRCPFCHNALLVTGLQEAEVIPEEEILSFLKKRTGILDGVAVTGGEPLLMPDIIEILKKIKSLGYSIKLDTNGTFPDRLQEIINLRLADYVAVDIKNSKEKYPETVGVPDFDISPVEKTVEILKNGNIDYEFRTTVTREFHSVESIRKAAEWIKGADKYFLQAFVDSGNLIAEGIHGVSKEEMEEMKKAAEQFIDRVEIRGV